MSHEKRHKLLKIDEPTSTEVRVSKQEKMLEFPWLKCISFILYRVRTQLTLYSSIP